MIHRNNELLQAEIYPTGPVLGQRSEWSFQWRVAKKAQDSSEQEVSEKNEASEIAVDHRNG